MLRCANAAKNSSDSVTCAEKALSATARSPTVGPTAMRRASGVATASSATATSSMISVMGSQLLDQRLDVAEQLVVPPVLRRHVDAVVEQLPGGRVDVDDLVVDDQRGQQPRRSHAGRAPRLRVD